MEREGGKGLGTLVNYVAALVEGGGGSPVPIEINEKKKMVGAMRDCAMQSSLIDF